VTEEAPKKEHSWFSDFWDYWFPNAPKKTAAKTTIKTNMKVSTAPADDVSQWLSNEVAPKSGVAWNRLFANIHPAGTVRGIVIASPSNKANATDNDYYYHWKREYF
jgi:hypothetical protein